MYHILEVSGIVDGERRLVDGSGTSIDTGLLIMIHDQDTKS